MFVTIEQTVLNKQFCWWIYINDNDELLIDYCMTLMCVIYKRTVSIVCMLCVLFCSSCDIN